jgi:glyoxylase-like metal-dependent hydrolase (beta-lactamase superfamily II)
MLSAPDLYRELGLRVFERGWLSSNGVLFDTNSNAESVLVDSGYWIHQDQTVALVRSALGDRPLDRVVNTHLHSDHCGGNCALAKVYGCAIDVPVGEAMAVDEWDPALLTYEATGQHCPRFERTGLVTPGATLEIGGQPWLVLGAPGHDPQALALFHEGSGTLISADALWENGFGVVFPEFEGIEAFSAVRATLDEFAARDVRWVIPGHGRPFGNVGRALETARRRLDSFVQDPERHARHAAKVLIKFRLLETRNESWQSLGTWIESMPYARQLHEAFFPTLIFEAWWQGIVFQLRDAGALSIESDGLHDR